MIGPVVNKLVLFVHRGDFSALLIYMHAATIN